jgi:hypothetical protein
VLVAALVLGLAACGKDRGVKLTDTEKARAKCARSAGRKVTARLPAGEIQALCDCVIQKATAAGYRYEKDVPRATGNAYDRDCIQEVGGRAGGRAAP